MTAAEQRQDEAAFKAELIDKRDDQEVWLIDGVEPPVVTPGDPAAMQEFIDARTRYWSLEKRQNADKYEQCKLLLMIRSRKLFLAAGYKSFVDCAEKEFGLSGRHAEKLSECARDYSPELFIELGTTLAILGLDYLKATPEDDSTADLRNALLKYGAGAGKPFVSASSREAREEIRGIREENEPPVQQFVPPDITETTNLLSDRVKKARFKLRNFKSGDTVTTGLVIELPDASREAVITQLAQMLGALGKPE